MIVAARRYCSSSEWFAMILAFCLIALTPVDPILAQSYKVDGPDSQSLTSYLRQHRLPLVGAQVLEGGAGHRRIVLYGFVATEYGRNDAARKAISYYSERGAESRAPAPAIENHIEIRPEIARMRTRGPGTVSADTSKESLDQVLGEINRYGVKTVPARPNPR